MKHLTRQLELIPLEVLSTPVTVIGAGAVGSMTVLALAKMGFNDITVFDDDTIEVENMNCQFYRHTDIGRPKVEALADIVQDFANERIVAVSARNDGRVRHAGVVVFAVDSMAARKQLWESYAQQALGTQLIVDPRMGAEAALCYAMRPMNTADCATYAKTLYSDDEAVFERCTAKATMYTAMLLSGYVAKVVKDFLVTRRYPRITQWNIAANGFECHTVER